MPVCLAVDSFNEMWCWGVNVPKLRAIIATVRNFARAAFTTFGVVAFCLLMSLSSPFRLFRLCSVQAMDTCIAPWGGLQPPSRWQPEPQPPRRGLRAAQQRPARSPARLPLAEGAEAAGVPAMPGGEEPPTRQSNRRSGFQPELRSPLARFAAP